MRKRMALMFGVILLSGLACGLGWVMTHFYILFSQSDDIFVWKHRWIPSLSFYTNAWEYVPGDDVQVFASMGGKDSVGVELFDILQTDTLIRKQIFVEHQPIDPSSAIEGVDWEISGQLTLPTSMPTGWYVIGLSRDGEQAFQSLFVRPRIAKKKIAWLFSTNTWNAYNSWGGYSIYSKNHTPTVSFQRPQLLSDPFIKNTYPNHQYYFQAANKDRYLAELLDTTGLEVDAFSMESLERGDSTLFAYHSWIISTHSEYWTRNMMQHLNDFLDEGGSLINLAGNVAAFETHLDLGERKMTVDRSIGNLWEERDTAGIRPFGVKPGFLGFHTYAPYEVLVDTSWMLEGTGLKKGDLLGEKSDSYDYTYMYGNTWELVMGLLRKGQVSAASGLEVDQIYEGTPDNWVTVACGLNPRLDGMGQVYPDEIAVPWKSGEAGHWGYYMHKGGGMVCGVSSMSFTGSLPFDPHIRQMVINMIKRSLSLRSHKSTSITKDDLPITDGSE